MVQATIEKALATSAQPVNAGQQKPASGLTAAQFLLHQLAAWGVTRIYGIIGDTLLTLLDELAKQHTIRFIACRHESAAALMASAEAKLTGGIGVCLATSGPGMANLLNGLADAALDRVPVLAITGQVPTGKIGTGAKQYIDQQLLAAPIAAHSRLIAHPGALAECLVRAMSEALTGGAVTHLSIPQDIFPLPAEGTIAPAFPHLRQTMYTPMELIEQAASLLRAAHRPVLYLGGGVKPGAAQAQELAKRLEAAVITTLPARALFPNDDPLYAGGLGHAGSEAASVLLAESDLIVTLGATWWPQDYVPQSVPILQIDRAPQQIGLGRPPRLGIVGDLPVLLPQLADKLGTQPDRAAWRSRIEQAVRSWQGRIRAEAQQDGTPLSPQRVIRAIAEHAAADAVLAVDTGDHTLWFDRIFHAKPQQDILISGSWRTLGFALPAAISAKLARPERQVIAISGDGGAVQTLLELQTAAQHGANITLIVIDNGCYAMEQNRMVARGLQPLGSGLVNPDFCRIAEACGCAAWKAETAQQLDDALKSAISGAQPALIQVRTAATAVPHTS